MRLNKNLTISGMSSTRSRVLIRLLTHTNIAHVSYPEYSVWNLLCNSEDRGIRNLWKEYNPSDQTWTMIYVR